MKQDVGVVAECCDTYEATLAARVEFAPEPIERYGAEDAGFSDGAGNGCKMIQAKD